jgi:hypothetical protein
MVEPSSPPKYMGFFCPVPNLDRDTQRLRVSLVCKNGLRSFDLDLIFTAVQLAGSGLSEQCRTIFALPTTLFPLSKTVPLYGVIPDSKLITVTRVHVT